MKLINILFFHFFVLTTLCFAQSPYAPWAKLSGSAPDKINAREYPVPSKSEVNVSPYPGAVLTSVSAPRQDTTMYEKEVLPFVALVTTDSPDKVINFYKKLLTPDKGWNYSQEYTTFVKGEIISALSGFVPSVAVRDENGDDHDLVYVDENLKKELKTRIRIFYKPDKTKE